MKETDEELLNPKYFVYIHYKKSDGSPFYVGVGTSHKNNGWYSQYARAYSKTNRSDFWHRTVEKYGGYDIKIIFRTNSFEIARLKEKEFIKLYGRKDNRTGILVNLTDGGEGVFNPSESNIAEYREYAKRNGEELLRHARAVHQYDVNGNYIASYATQKEAALAVAPDKIKGYHMIYHSCHKASALAYGFKWSLIKVNKIEIPLSVKAKLRLDKQKEQHPIENLEEIYYKKQIRKEQVRLIRSKLGKKLQEANSKEVYQYDKEGNYIATYLNPSEAAMILYPEKPRAADNIYYSCKHPYALAYKYKWSYIKSDKLFIDRSTKPIGKVYCQKRVVKLHPETNEILEQFASISEATRAISGKSESTISAACNGKTKMAYGFKWKFVDGE